MILTKEETDMAEGKHGPGIERCMNMLIKLGEALGAEKMVPISSAHTMPNEPLELLAEMTEGVDHTGAFTTLHPWMSAFSPKNWQRMGIPEAFAEKELPICEQREAVYRRAGFYQTYSCLPMQVGNFPRKGDFLSWIGSGAQLLVNSLVGARCNRDGTIVTLASAITGRTPYHGLHLDENRYAQVRVTLDNIDPTRLTHAELGAIGYYIGAKAQNRNVVIDGLSRNLDFNQLKYLMAPLSVSGSVSICHISGVTPEAPDSATALAHREPAEVVIVGAAEIEQSMAQYAGDGEGADMAIFGCPHCTVPEAKRLAWLLDGKKIGVNQHLWIGMPYQMYYLARQMGYTQTIEKAGGCFASACMATIPESPIPDGVRTVVTNSFKAAHYITLLTKGRVNVLVGDMDACVNAVTGQKWKGGNA